MKEKEQGYYESAIPDPSNVTSLHAEMLRSRDYGDKRLYPDYGELRSIGDTWADERHNPLRSKRALGDIALLLNRVTFELVERQKELAWGEFDQIALSEEVEYEA